MIAALIGLGALLPLGLLSALDFSSTEDDIEDDVNDTHEHAESQEIPKIGLNEFLEQATVDEPNDVEDDTDEDLDDPRLIEYEGAIIDRNGPIAPIICVDDIQNGTACNLIEVPSDEEAIEEPIITRPAPTIDFAPDIIHQPFAVRDIS